MFNTQTGQANNLQNQRNVQIRSKNGTWQFGFNQFQRVPTNSEFCPFQFYKSVKKAKKGIYENMRGLRGTLGIFVPLRFSAKVDFT